MSKKDEYILLNTYFDKVEIEKKIYVLKENGISFKVVDKSNQPNYRVPSSTYIEVDILVRPEDFEIAFNLIKGRGIIKL